MVIINQLNIDALAENIVIDIATTVGNVFTSIKLWTSTTFQDPAQSVDLSSFIVGTDETENLTIPLSAITGVPALSGLFFIEFLTDEVVPPTACCEDANKRLAVVANFIKYHECVLNKLLTLEIDDCGMKSTNCVDCGGCEDCAENVLSVQAYLKGLNLAVQQGFYKEAIEILKILDTLCSVCTTCPDYGDAVLLAGGGFGVYNDVLTLL